MTVEHNGGPVFIQQRAEAFKAAVRGIRLIPEAGDRRMGEKDIKAAGAAKLPAKGRNAFPHFCFRIHTGRVRVIPDGAPKPKDPKPVRSNNTSVRIDAALRRLLLVTAVVVAVHIDDRSVREAGKIRQVRGWEIAAGENDIGFLQRRLTGSSATTRIRRGTDLFSAAERETRSLSFMNMRIPDSPYFADRLTREHLTARGIEVTWGILTEGIIF